MLRDKKKPIIYLLLLLVVLTAGYEPLYAQKSKEQLKREKQQKQQRIKEVEKILQQTSSEKQSTLGELNAINQRIQIQENLMGTIRSEIQYLDSEIGDTRMIIESLQEDIELLKKEYANMVYAAYKSNHGINKLTFLFSSSSFSELRARWKYMEYYSEARKNQAEQIKKVAETLEFQIAGIEEKRNEKTALLDEQLKENQSLVGLKDKRAGILQSLESQETKLRSDLDANKAALASLEKKITEIINAEIAASSTPEKSAEIKSLSGTFAKNKTKLNWPVEGFVSQKFGRQKHAALKGVVIDNDGISIQTQKNEKARAIFDGDVRFVFFVPTMGYSALIKHGEYFTVYGGLKDPTIKAGDTVKAGQILGEVVTKPEGVTELWFEIRKGRDPLNPEQWLAKR